MRIRVERHVQFSNCAIKTKQNRLCGTVCTPPGCDEDGESDRLFDGNTDLTVEDP